MTKFNLKTIIALYILISFNITNTPAQNHPTHTATVSGCVIDKTNNKPLTGATVVVKSTTQGAITDTSGNFKISISDTPKSIILVISFMGYDSHELSYTIKEADGRLKNNIVLATDNLILEEIKVVGSASTAIIKGDTMQFNSGAFKTNPDAMAEDLIVKMPGFEVEDGKIKAQGENITRIYVDGKSFFKNDPMAALSSLPADLIESIQLFDEKSEKSQFTGTDDGSRITTINIVTKTKENSMKMGEATAGYGSDNKYSGRANINYFEGNNRFSVGVGANNINQSPLSGSKYYGRHGVSGLQETLGVKLNYSGEYKREGNNKTDLGASYVYNKRSTNSESEKLQQSLYNNEVYNAVNNTLSASESHYFSLDLKNTSGTNMIIFEPYASINSSSSEATKDMERSRDDYISNKSKTYTKNGGSSYNVGGRFEWMKRIGDKSSVAVGTHLKFSENESDQILIGNSAKYDINLEELVDSLINQNKEVYSGNNTTKGFINYNYKITPSKSISAEYELSYDWSDSDNIVYLYDPITDEYTDIYNNLSNIFNRDYLTNIGGVRYSASEKDKYKFNFGVNYQHAALQNDLIFPEDKSYNYSFNSIRINSRLMYYFSKSKRLTLSYTGRPNLPSVGQLQDVVNNTNPLMVSKGNPNLEQSFSNSLNLRYFSSNIERSTSVNIFSSIRQESNSFANNVVKIQADTLVNGVSIQGGSQLSTTVNLGNKWVAATGADYSFPVNFISSKMNIGTIYRFTRKPSIYNNITKQTDNNYVNARVSIHSNISENLDFSIYNTVAYTHAKSSNKSTASSEFITDRVSATLNWVFLKNFIFNTSYSFNYNHYFDNGTTAPKEDNKFQLLNAGLGYKFLNRNAEVRISGFDLLNQSQSIVRSVGEQFVTDNITNVLQQYYIITLSFKFNSMKSAMHKRQKRADKLDYNRGGKVDDQGGRKKRPSKVGSEYYPS